MDRRRRHDVPDWYLQLPIMPHPIHFACAAHESLAFIVTSQGARIKSTAHARYLHAERPREGEKGEEEGEKERVRVEAGLEMPVRLGTYQNPQTTCAACKWDLLLARRPPSPRAVNKHHDVMTR